MRRLLAIVLLALLPLQFSWAAVAPYCGHEMDSVGHFGHHEHHHRADAAPATGDVTDGAASGEQTPGDVDADCGHCHGTCSAMPFLHQVAPEAPASALPRAGVALPGVAHSPARPERPQWPPLA